MGPWPWLQVLLAVAAIVILTFLAKLLRVRFWMMSLQRQGLVSDKILLV